MSEARRGGANLTLIRGYLAAMGNRTVALKSHALEPSRWPSPTAATEAVLQELDTAQEELLVADEELRAQSEELERIRQGIAGELRRFRDVFDHSPDGYVETDARGTIRIANRTLATQLELLPQFLERKPLVSFVVRSDCDRFRKMVAQLASGKPARASLRLRPRQGRAVFSVDVHATPLLDASNHVLGLRWAIRTMTPVDDDAPPSLASLTALANALVAHTSTFAAGKRVALVLEIGEARPLCPELSAHWFPILSAVLRAEVALARQGTEVSILANEEGASVVWQIGSARVALQRVLLKGEGASSQREPPSGD